MIPDTASVTDLGSVVSVRVNEYLICVGSSSCYISHPGRSRRNPLRVTYDGNIQSPACYPAVITYKERAFGLFCVLLKQAVMHITANIN